MFFWYETICFEGERKKERKKEIRKETREKECGHTKKCAIVWEKK